MNQFADLTDDLNLTQFQDLLQYLWAQQGARISRANIRAWRRARNLPSD